jgi:hypothetical protein
MKINDRHVSGWESGSGEVKRVATASRAAGETKRGDVV